MDAVTRTWAKAQREMRNWQEFARSLRNYDWLGEAVPGAMDVDFLIERRGNFLVLEFKPYSNGVQVGFGQHLALTALASQENFDVYLVGERDSDGALFRLNYATRQPTKNRTRPVWFKPRQFERTSRDGLREFVELWFAEASAA